MRKKLFSLLVVLPVFLLHIAATADQEQAAFPDLEIEIRKVSDSGASPFWSPDGKEIVYVDKGGPYVISANGTERARKILSGPVRLPRWSPDGKYISYVDRRGLKIISPDVSEQPGLIYPDNNIQMPVWSPDSKWITFYRSELQGYEGSGVIAVNIENLKSIQLSYRGINPSWSSDGKSVFYFIEDYTPPSSSTPPQTQIPSPPGGEGKGEGESPDQNKKQIFGRLFLAKLDGSAVKKLAPIGAGCMNFNSKGDLLAFAPKSKDGNALGIHVASPFKDEEPVNLSDDGYFPSFSFDSKLVSFFKYDPRIKNTKIYITLPTGGKPVAVGKGIYPRWAFNKKELVYETLGVRGGIYVAKISN